MSEDRITATTVLRLPRGVRIRFDEARDQWMLLGPERVLKLDNIALEILKRCNGENDLQTIIDDLARAFEADAAVIESDVKAFIADLRVRGFIELL